jgi:ATP-dependent DNA ligase
VYRRRVNDADWVFEAKFDGFRAAADTVRGRLISRNGNRMQRFERVLDLLPKGHVFDGELVVLDDAGRPLFNELLFGRRRPTYVAFDLLIDDGIDLRPLPLKQRKARLALLRATHSSGPSRPTARPCHWPA